MLAWVFLENVTQIWLIGARLLITAIAKVTETRVTSKGGRSYGKIPLALESRRA